jgi:hypothetical protein
MCTTNIKPSSQPAGRDRPVNAMPMERPQIITDPEGLQAPLSRHQPSAHLLATAQAEHQVQRRLLLDVVIGERTAVFQLLARENEALLIRWDALLVLDFRLYVVDRVGRLNFERNRLAGHFWRISNSSIEPRGIRGKTYGS